MLEPLKAAAVEPHWGSKLVGSALERWLGALNEWLQASVDPSGSAVPVKSAQAALGAAQAQLQAALQQLRTLPGAGGQLGGEQLRSAVEGLLQSVQALVDAAAAKLPEVGALPRLELPPLSLSMQLPSDFAAAAASSDTGMVMALGALAGGLAVVAAAAARGSGPGGGSSSGGGPGSGGPGGGSRPSGTYLPSVYDAEQVAAYFEARPGLVATRSAQVAAEAAQLGAALLLDQATGEAPGRGGSCACLARDPAGKGLIELVHLLTLFVLCSVAACICSWLQASWTPTHGGGRHKCAL